MSKRTRGPFPGLNGLPELDVNTADDLDILERMDLVNGVLAAENCNCNGHALGAQRDPYWAGDISELVCRGTSHEVYSIDEEGNPATQIVSIKLETLTVEVDANDEVCAWIYEES